MPPRKEGHSGGAASSTKVPHLRSRQRLERITTSAHRTITASCSFRQRQADPLT